MFKSIKNLAMAYFRENWLADILTIILFSIVIIITYFVFMGLMNKELENVRTIIIWIWVSIIAMYTIRSAFSGYRDIRQSYIKLLLPASLEAKFIWEWFRTLILFGGITLGLLFAIDAGVEYIILKFTLDDIGEIELSRSLIDTLFRTNEPLNYLPIMVYVAILWHSALFLFSTRINMILGKLVIIAVWVLAVSLVSYNRSLLYPFISQQEHWGFLSIQLSWASRSVEYVLSYMWLAALPIAFYSLSYFKIKESKI